jgi:hypothetical protein
MLIHPSPWSHEDFRKPENEKSYTIKLNFNSTTSGITGYTKSWGHLLCEFDELWLVQKREESRNPEISWNAPRV